MDSFHRTRNLEDITPKRLLCDSLDLLALVSVSITVVITSVRRLSVRRLVLEVGFVQRLRVRVIIVHDNERCGIVSTGNELKV